MEELILDDLLNEIISGKYEADEPLPSEPILSQRYGVPRIVVRRAYYQLEERGYVRSYKGRGRFLSRPKKQVVLPIDDGRSFTEKLQISGAKLVTHNLGVKLVEPGCHISERLGLEQRDTVYSVPLLRVIDGEPAALHTTFLDEKRFPSIEASGSSILSLYEYFSSHGYSRLESHEVTLSVSLPTLDEQETLMCRSLVPIFVSEYGIRSSDGIVAYNKSIYRGDRFKYRLFTGGSD